MDPHFIYNVISLAAGGIASEERLIYNSSMSEEDFYRWLRSRGISEKDCNALSGKYNRDVQDCIITSTRSGRVNMRLATITYICL